MINVGAGGMGGGGSKAETAQVRVELGEQSGVTKWKTSGTDKETSSAAGTGKAGSPRLTREVANVYTTH